MLMHSSLSLIIQRRVKLRKTNLAYRWLKPVIQLFNNTYISEIMYCNQSNSFSKMSCIIVFQMMKKCAKYCIKNILEVILAYKLQKKNGKDKQQYPNQQELLKNLINFKNLICRQVIFLIFLYNHFIQVQSEYISWVKQQFLSLKKSMASDSQQDKNTSLVDQRMKQIYISYFKSFGQANNIDKSELSILPLQLRKEEFYITILQEWYQNHIKNFLYQLSQSKERFLLFTKFLKVKFNLDSFESDDLPSEVQQLREQFHEAYYQYIEPFFQDCLNNSNNFFKKFRVPVSYTHLTLPTICSVQISVVAVSLKKKKKKIRHQQKEARTNHL
eukprot:TRINITY_DN13050_c0_g1_i1.p1 TRINITY_DN13050_c0_g1~~TRINITY_DN13050_c0_g1_i1.p1  ORF type:complete len:329 (-),score=44.08 TRINITY_DN13050_c0_g1_i1:33-1019(-)